MAALYNEGLSQWWAGLDEKEAGFVYPYRIFTVHLGYIQLPQGEPEIKYLLQEGMSRDNEGSSLANPSGPI